MISAETYALVKDLGIVAGPPLAISAKGKSNSVYVHQVIGYRDEQDALQTVLDAAKIEDIHDQELVEVEEEEKVKLASKKPSEDQMEKIPAGVTEIQANEEKGDSPFPEMKVPLARKPQIHKEEALWYVDVLGTGDAIGPFTVSEIALKVAHGQIHPRSAYAFREGDSESIPVEQIPGVNRRTEMPPIKQEVPPPSFQQAAPPSLWFIYGPSGENLGPYTKEQIQDMLLKGNINRTTYVWTQGYDQWIYAYQIPGFDRREVA